MQQKNRIVIHNLKSKIALLISYNYYNNVKFILFKKTLTIYNCLVNLRDSAPNFGASLPEISGQNRANLLGYWIW